MTMTRRSRETQRTRNVKRLADQRSMLDGRNACSAQLGYLDHSNEKERTGGRQVAFVHALADATYNVQRLC